MKQVDKWLKKWTDQDSLYWMNRIGALIAKTAKLIKGSGGLQGCDPGKWLGMLAKELTKAIEPKLGVQYDENIALSKFMGLILAMWSYRIGRAKCYDCRRQLRARRESMKRLMNYPILLMECLMDESLDHVYFPAQGWDPPFPKEAKYTPDEGERKRQAYYKKVSKK